MKKDIDTVKVKRESVRIWMGVGLAVFGCIMILVGVCIPPVGVIDGSVLTATGEIFGLSGASMGIFAYTKRDNAKIDYMYRHFVDRYENNNDQHYYGKETEYGTSAEENVQ